MVAVFNKELLSWYMITVKLREQVEQQTGNENTDETGSSDLSIDLSTSPLSHLPFHSASTKELLCWYIITLTLRKTIYGNIYKCGPSTSTPVSNLLHQDIEASSVQSEHAPIASIPVLEVPQSLPTSAEQPENTVLFMQDMLKKAKMLHTKNPWAKLSIYRVPKTMQEGDEKSYMPQMVSIGPFHHGRKDLADMEQHKWRAVHQVLERTGHDIDRYFNAILPLENWARSSYEGPIKMSTDKFVLSLVIDGIFLLELFIGATNRNGFIQLGYSRHDPIFATRSIMHTMLRDMIMLENQIPLFVLGRLLAVQLGQPEKLAMVSRLAVSFFHPLMPTYEHDEISYESDEVFDPLADVGLHSLDAFRLSLLKTNIKEVSEPSYNSRNMSISSYRRVRADKGSQLLMQCASKLQKAGIRCMRKNSNCFWDISFDNDGILQIPRILIHDGTKSLFLNMIAFEQCHADAARNVTSYVIFMDNLVNTEEDVRYLHDRGIIEHWLATDKDVADLFSRLCQEVVIDFYNRNLRDLSDRVNRYYKNQWNIRRHNWCFTLKKNYLSNPWTIISIVAAVVLLLLTFGQTYYTVYAYYRPP